MPRLEPRALLSRFSLASMLSVGLTACPEDTDADANAGTDTDTDGVDSVQPAVVTTTSGPIDSSGSASPSGSTSSGASTDDSTDSDDSSGTDDSSDSDGSSGSTGASTECGDGVVAGDEECDGDELGGAACPIVGEVTCSAECTLDTSACTDTLTVCDAPAASFGPNQVLSSVSVADDFFVTDVNVYLDVLHSYVGDIIATVTDPADTTVLLLDEWGCGFFDVDAWFDDEALAGPTCDAPPDAAVNGVALPEQPLSAFMGAQSMGEWELLLVDAFTVSDDGFFNEWCVELTLSADDPTELL